MPSLAERAIMSAHDTVKGHSSSTAALMVFTYLKFLIPKLLSDVCSDTKVPSRAVSKSSDASHDCITIQFSIRILIFIKLFTNIIRKLQFLTWTMQSWNRFLTH